MDNLKLYKISQTENVGYDTYDSAVVAAKDKETARNMNPNDGNRIKVWEDYTGYGDWCSSPDNVTVEYLGDYVGGVEGVIVASFNAG